MTGCGDYVVPTSLWDVLLYGWKRDLDTGEGWAKLGRKNRNENVEMYDGNTEYWQDHDGRNKS